MGHYDDNDSIAEYKEHQKKREQFIFEQTDGAHCPVCSSDAIGVKIEENYNFHSEYWYCKQCYTMFYKKPFGK